MQKQAGLHPIATLVLKELLHEDGVVTLPSAGLLKVADHLDALADDPALVWAVRSLLGLALHLELDKKQPQPAHALMRLVARRAPAPLDRQLDQARGRADDQRRAVRTAFSRLSALEVDRGAPRFGARAPEGAVNLAALTAGRRDRDPRRALAERRARAR